MSSPAYRESRSKLFSNIFVIHLTFFVSALVLTSYNGVITLFVVFIPKRIVSKEVTVGKFCFKLRFARFGRE